MADRRKLEKLLKTSEKKTILALYLPYNIAKSIKKKQG